MKNTIKLTIILLLSTLSLSGCFWSDKEKRESITKGWSPKTFFQQAKNSDSTEESIELFEQLQAAYPGSKYALQSKLEVAYRLYKNEDYNAAILRLNDYIKLYPEHFSTPYAYYLRGVISEDKSRSILDNYLTDNAQRDVKSVRNAFNYYMALIDKFPNTEYTEEAKTRLIILRNILARHELFVAIYYTKREANIAAINRAKFIIEKYPNTPSVPAALHLMARNYDSVGMDRLAKDTRRVLKKSYPLYEPHYTLDG
ncbi:Outer membrane beta-barrel assembly protein BamD [uncultured Gammaproteobacteria bacterium]|jgi:outer membrane protein assembly factor BamD|uniref:Outer membrane beta-barrel assembly protein BamD n=3 Tax=sulfur-oxidizing symbionts TaxID=32036 RepID=A0ACA8ZNK3_9GAMM|nr:MULTISPECIES: outer membrane protein assembly factor BamD [sulfur-oxidizing symbionts]CAC9486638.1 Outer membrane beta-barrel assembly protein BamD [uncultured Gammaproteobacteria bacterium]CAB5496869.1 Outer membrane beta-barrel assembly protein BamD [Bathymodiolus azoricus thioautotrophic gill symbiont]CAB5508063.1 Outer membrane beta-barrel assembly protein BamD [Bathymodiolus thermophilus thioautotrophic gill symbiont]CAC9503608.1 Outer membrane beta-barrel assembly protein BamD [uncultu